MCAIRRCFISIAFQLCLVCAIRRCFISIAFQLCLVCAIRRFQVNQDQPKLNRTYQLFVYVGGVNILGGRVRTVKKNTDVSVVASKENGIEPNGHISQSGTKYMVKSRDQIARTKSQ